MLFILMNFRINFGSIDIADEDENRDLRMEEMKKGVGSIILVRKVLFDQLVAVSKVLIVVKELCIEGYGLFLGGRLHE